MEAFKELIRQALAKGASCLTLQEGKAPEIDTEPTPLSTQPLSSSWLNTVLSLLFKDHPEAGQFAQGITLQRDWRIERIGEIKVLAQPKPKQLLLFFPPHGSKMLAEKLAAKVEKKGYFKEEELSTEADQTEVPTSRDQAAAPSSAPADDSIDPLAIDTEAMFAASEPSPTRESKEERKPEAEDSFIASKSKEIDKGPPPSAEDEIFGHQPITEIDPFSTKELAAEEVTVSTAKPSQTKEADLPSPREKFLGNSELEGLKRAALPNELIDNKDQLGFAYTKDEKLSNAFRSFCDINNLFCFITAKAEIVASLCTQVSPRYTIVDEQCEDFTAVHKLIYDWEIGLRLPSTVMLVAQETPSLSAQAAFAASVDVVLNHSELDQLAAVLAQTLQSKEALLKSFQMKSLGR